MCGIIGYIGAENAILYLIKGLKNLEYRGYDSVGIAVIKDGKLEIRKGAGKIEEVKEAKNFLELSGNIGIGHTRWATHGKVCDENAHPHFDCHGSIAIVHNGIIDNYKELREELEAKGHKFHSETDSEVVAHLIEEYLKEGISFENAFIKAISRLEGSYAILAIKEGEEKILAARKFSPLVLGIAKDGIFVASDIPSFLEWTNKVVYLSDYDVIIVEKNSYRIFNIKENAWVSRPIDTVSWDTSQISKGNFEHYMLKEIIEQSEVIQRAINQDKKLIEDVCDLIRNAKGIFFVASGTSYHASLVGSYYFSKIANTHVNVVLASEFENYRHFLKPETLVIAVSQSGETADVLEAVRVAKDAGSKVIGVVNVPGSSLTRESDLFVQINAGPEIGVAATKTYTAQVILMYLLSNALVGKYEEAIDKIKSLYMDVYNLTSRAMRDHIRMLSERLKEKEHIYLIGRGIQYATALEGALKIKEISYIHAEAFPAGELKHGPLALIEKDTPVIVFASKENEAKVIANAEEAKSRGAYIIGVSYKRSDIFDFWIKVPEVGDLNPIVQIIPMQVLAYQLAVLRGYDPDKPRNLAKSVTVI
ncbi:MAG TPA: glutamine--fructose-6-phosphate transaminase (isomerizing) [Euryarchaeota archaeon]|nr:glutamine--fructose-6-phosphate transaminase (isomerizing) [Euryarchaeota archaeon]